ncbi:hypothetical protein PENTCL1PPCAC_8538 [Pristionchus entomophagus]|uniref:Uncharacterized protein n=1 Tax=Pristionchus entomophagus TaxID=358040 RepID=A0AAV5SWG0_9BILA|nr:hypothetical protein PENTCL1PPCAC_8538 [Pristionchus entomophagus]
MTPVTIPKNEDFNVHCAAKACSLCSKPTSDGKPTGDGNFVDASPTAGDVKAGTCAEATCKSVKDSWQYEDVNGNKKTIVSTMACKKDGQKAAWFMDKNNAQARMHDALRKSTVPR